jgi:glycosyltransferase involved in cell wall biosynthesis
MPRLVQISFSAIPDDPRVRRHGDGLRQLGWDVAGLGLDGGRGHPPDWPVVSVPSVLESAGAEPAAQQDDQLGAQSSQTTVVPKRALWKSLARGAWFVCAGILSAFVWLFSFALRAISADRSRAYANLAKIIATDIGWPIRVVRRLKQIPVRELAGAMIELERRRPVAALIEAGRKLGPADIWVANDWTALPVAMALKAEFGGQIVYDSHEFAIEEYAQDWAWRKYERPIAASIEGHLIKQAKVITAVSSGIVEALRARYQVPVAHEVVINAPPYVPIALRKTGTPIKLLYHGVVAPGRGLELLIEAAALWTKALTLAIRGPGQTDYLASLNALILKHKVEDRVMLLPPVAMTNLVEAATQFDVGIMALPGHSQHNRFALPNKVFEYMGAGLALVVSDLPEMAHVIKTTGCGVTLPSDRPSEVAALFDQMTTEQIDGFKQNALLAAKTYNGERSAATLDALYRAILPESS